MAEERSRKRYYRQTVPASGLSVERGTERVPSNGRFYVILGDEIKGKFVTKTEALRLYHSLLRDMGYSPPGPSGKDAVIGVFMDELERYLSEGHKSKHGEKGEDADFH